MSEHVDQVDAATMAEMRAWAKDCEWREAQDNGMTSAEYVDELSDEEVLAGIDRHYGGGAAQFVRDGS